jgi:hypothetical protein
MKLLLSAHILTAAPGWSQTSGKVGAIPPLRLSEMQDVPVRSVLIFDLIHLDRMSAVWAVLDDYLPSNRIPLPYGRYIWGSRVSFRW